MQFVITAYDGQDEGALERRMAVRETHVDGAKELMTAGKLIAGGAILDEANEMIGSTLYVEFDSRDEFDQWLV